MKLSGQRKIDWVAPVGCPSGFKTVEVVQGNSDQSAMYLEVAVANWDGSSQPTRDQLKRLHLLRVNKTATPVVLVIELDSRGTLIFGPNADAAPIGPLPQEQVQRIVQAALDEPTVLAARTRLAGLAQAVDSTKMPGVKNSGLFANHELQVGVPQRADWLSACEKSIKLLAERGPQLISRLGFKTERTGAHALVLSGAGSKPEAIAVLLDEREAFDADSPRFSVSPVAWGLKVANSNGVPWLIVLRGTQLRLYPARIDLGIGRKGLAETFFEVDLPHLTAQNAGFLDLVFSAEALAEGGSTYEILRSSVQYAVALGARLRDKVYEDIVPELSVAVADALVELDYEMDAKGLDLAYQLTLRVFFRMLFQVYAEDRKLLPYGENAKYDRNAIKTIAKDLVENKAQEFDTESTTLWDDLAQVWRVIDSGDRAWGVPAYNGGLFTSEKDVNEHGAILKDIRITNDVMGPVLKALLLDDDGEGGLGQVDFRSLSVREFGTIYEGLLESSLGLAEVDLTLDEDGTWIPAKKKDEVYAYAGQVYFHNTSGQRKGTGSYFTPSFVVEHLLERSLDPALDSHLEKIAALITKGDQAGAGELFFDFRVADLAMGSGHFLTAAIDHIEQKMAAFLAEDGHVIPGVSAELLKLEQAAITALGPDSIEPERSSLLRRQIARRCIYGLDINPIAVELARVSIWIHTFVRGLPMSSLDHNLVCGDSLTGIGSVDEALDVLVPNRNGQISIFDGPIKDALEDARIVLADAALLAEVTKEESRAATKAAKKAYKDAEKARLLFDAAVLTRIGRSGLVAGGDPNAIVKLAAQPAAQDAIAALKPAHLPALFPEVFLRKDAGFDALIGNPPWDMVHVEEDVWWGKFIPGARGLPVKEMNSVVTKFRKSRPDLEAEFERERDSADTMRAALLAGPYPGLGSGHVDLYQVFAWRNLQTCNSTGAIGLVLPRVALSGSGSAQWREQVLTAGSIDCVFVVNNREWVFKGVDGRYSIAFVTIRPESKSPSVKLSGPFFSKEDFDKDWHNQFVLTKKTITDGSPTLAIPLLSSPETGAVYVQMRKSPSLSNHPMFHARPVQGDLNAAADKAQFIKGGELDDKRVPVFAGATFEIWNPDFGLPYGAANTEKISKWLLEKCQSASRNSRSAHFGSEYKVVEDIPFSSPRIAYRGVSNATNSRTFVCCLVPPRVVMTHGSPYFKFVSGEPTDEPYLLGVMSSLPFDWYMRKWVELNVTFELVSPAPIPEIDRGDARYKRVVTLSVKIGAIDSRFSTWARKFEEKTGMLKREDEKVAAIAEIDALVAHLYGLSRSQLEHVFKTFHRGWDYSSRLERVLEFYDQLPKVKS